MELKPKNNCPLNGFAPCKELDCAWFVHILGKDPQTNMEKDEWGCAVAWLPILLVENAQVERQTGAAVESFRNEMADHKSGLDLLVQVIENRRKLICE